LPPDGDSVKRHAAELIVTERQRRDTDPLRKSIKV